VTAAAALAPASAVAIPYDADDVELRRERWIPEWVRRVGAPVWVTGPSGRVVYVNERAERLLATTGAAALGRPCHEVVAARTATGAPFCSARCPVAAAAACRDAEVAPVDVQIGGLRGRERHWLQITSIPVESPDRAKRWIVHVAHVADRERRLERHVARVAARSEEIREIDAPAARRPLSAREREVLDLLAMDVEPSRIAAQLGIAYVTVRNHVQRLLAKLGAHSIEEAVAMRVLSEA